MISPKLSTQLASSLNSTLSQMWQPSRGLSWPRHVTEHLCFISASVLLSIWHSTFTYLCITDGTKRDKTLSLLLKQCLTYNKSSISTIFFLINVVSLMNHQSQVWASLVAQTVKNLPAMWETQVWSMGQKDLLEKGMATHSSILA